MGKHINLLVPTWPDKYIELQKVSKFAKNQILHQLSGWGGGVAHYACINPQKENEQIVYISTVQCTPLKLDDDKCNLNI